MTPPTLHPERQHCLGCRLLQSINGVLECVNLIHWHQGTPPDPPCKRPMLRVVGKPEDEG